MFPNNHLARYANISSLYQQALKKNIQQAKFQDFIYDELANNA